MQNHLSCLYPVCHLCRSITILPFGSQHRRTRTSYVREQPFYVQHPLSELLLDLTSFEEHPAPSCAWTTAVSCTNNGQGQIISLHRHYRRCRSVDIADIIVFDGDFRSSVKRLYLLIEQALNRPGSPLTPPVHSCVRANFCNGSGNFNFERIIHIYSLVARLLVSRTDISQGELRVHVARGAIETNIRNVEIRGNVWLGTVS